MLENDPNNESSEDKPFRMIYHSHPDNPNEYYLKVSELIDYLNYEANKHPDFRDLERMTIESIRDSIQDGLRMVKGQRIIEEISSNSYKILEKESQQNDIWKNAQDPVKDIKNSLDNIESGYKRLDIIVNPPWKDSTAHFNMSFRLDENGNIISKEDDNSNKESDKDDQIDSTN